jgi:hypothetical protein
MHDAAHARSSFVPSLFSAMRWMAVIASSSIERKGAITAGIKSVLPVLSVAPRTARVKAEYRTD